MASKGHFLTQMPQPMQRGSDIQQILESLLASTQSFPVRTTGQNFLHSCLHFFGLQRSELTMAIRSLALSPASSSLPFLPISSDASKGGEKSNGLRGQPGR